MAIATSLQSAGIRVASRGLASMVFSFFFFSPWMYWASFPLKLESSILQVFNFGGIRIARYCKCDLQTMPIWALHPKNRESPVGQGPEECVVLLQARYHCLRRANSKTFNKWESVEDSNGSSNQKYYDGLLVGDLQRVDIQGQLASL